jgi:hypothetical protein
MLGCVLGMLVGAGCSGDRVLVPGAESSSGEPSTGTTIASCNPIAQDCPRGQACYPIVDDWWSCVPDASGGGGAYGEPCDFTNECDPGLICVDVSYVPPGLPCEGAGGCCTEVCDIDDPLGDLQCAGAAEGQTCQPWFEDGEAPPEHEDVGACAMPQ